MQKDEIKKYLLRMFTGFGSLALAILFFFLCLRIGAFVEAFRKLLAILAPFIYGGVMAYLLAPACRRFEEWMKQHLGDKLKKGPRRALAIALSLLMAGCVIAVLLLLLIPQLVQNITTLINDMPEYINNTTNWITDLAENYPVVQEQVVPMIDEAMERLYQWGRDELLPNWQSLLSSVTVGVRAVLSTLKNFVIGLIAAVYLLAGHTKFLRHAKALLHSVFAPKWADRIERELKFADDMFGGFIYGKLIDSAIIGVICFFVCSLLGIPSTMLVSVIIGVTNIIPFFGPFIGAVPCAVLILMVSPIHCLWFILFIFVLQQFDGNILGPRILGNATGLPSFWVLFSILLFGGLFGFVGMIVGVPAFAVIMDVMYKLVHRQLQKHGRLDLLDPLPEEK